MVKKKLRILSRIFTVLYLVLSCVVFSCNNYDCRDNRLIVSTGIDPENNIDTVYFLIDNSSRDVIYYAGWDPIEENFVTDEYQIFIEENIMQEFYDFILVYDMKTKILYKAYNIWEHHIQPKTLGLIIERGLSPYEIGNVDLINNQIELIFIDGNKVQLQLEKQIRCRK